MRCQAIGLSTATLRSLFPLIKSNVGRVRRGIARPSEHVTEAVVLRGRDYSESDRIVVFLTREFGKVSAIAKGAKRSRKRFVNVLEPFSHVRLRFRQPRASDLAFVVACDRIEIFKNLTTDFVRYAHAVYATEVADRVSKGREITAETYQTVRDLLEAVNNGWTGGGLLRAFEMNILRQTGYLPRLRTCHSCGRDLGCEPQACFFPGGGGLVCRHCRRKEGFVVSGETIAFLLAVDKVRLRELPAGLLSPTARVSAEARVLLRGLLGAALGGPLKSDRLLEEPGAPP